MYAVTNDPLVLTSAEKAARRILAMHATTRGGITHDAAAAEKKATLYLSDNASFGLGLLRLFEATKDSAYLTKARAIADFMIAELSDDEGGGMFASTKDPDAVGVFAKRRVPFEDDVVAIRMLSRLGRALPTAEAKKYAIAIDRLLRAVSQPDQIKSRGRMTGDYILALEESKGVRGALR
jgi:uncharacterized protein YyaL (SSP411 family)